MGDVVTALLPYLLAWRVLDNLCVLADWLCAREAWRTEDVG